MKLAALDTGILLRLENGDTVCEEAIDILNGFGFGFIVTDTPRNELYLGCDQAETPELKEFAKSTILRARRDFSDPSLKSLDQTYADIFAARLYESGLLNGGKKEDGLALAEAGLLGARIFITDRPAIVQVDYRRIMIEISASDLPFALPIPPEDVIAAGQAAQTATQKGSGI